MRDTDSLFRESCLQNIVQTHYLRQTDFRPQEKQERRPVGSTRRLFVVPRPHAEITAVAVDGTGSPVDRQHTRSGRPEWTTQKGEPISASRVQRIRLAQDVLTPNEQAVYDALWKTPDCRGEKVKVFRVVSAGRKILARHSRLSTKTIQRVIPKLKAKDFIEVEQPANSYLGTPTVYRVFAYGEVLRRQNHKGHLHVAKIGPGLSFAYPLIDDRDGTDLVQLATGVDGSVNGLPAAPSPMSAGVNLNMSPGNMLTTGTVDSLHVSTVVNRSPIYIGIDDLDIESEATIVYQALSRFGNVDAECLARLIGDCRQRVPDCSPQEIRHFIDLKGRDLTNPHRRIQSPIGFLVKTVPRCFEGPPFRQFRAEAESMGDAERQRTSADHAASEGRRLDYERRLKDPTTPEDDKALLRNCLELEPLSANPAQKEKQQYEF